MTDRAHQRRIRIAVPAAAAALLITGCPGPPATPPAHRSGESVTGGHGPDFPLCGGVDDRTVAELTGQPGLTDAGKNSTGCQWHRLGGPYDWPRIVFAWYRGSPIGRERKIAESMGKRVDDVTISGHRGFVDLLENPRRVICEVAIGFGDDFIEWSLSFNRAPLPDACGIAQELTRRSIANAH